jgi:DNA-binding protein HU-beta
MMLVPVHNTEDTMAGLNEVAKSAGVKPDEVEEVFEQVLRMVADGQTVRIKGFGAFERKLYAGRTLTTPAVNDGKAITFPDSFVLRFRQSQVAKQRINAAAKKGKKADGKKGKTVKKASAKKATKKAASKKAASKKGKPAKPAEAAPSAE